MSEAHIENARYQFEEFHSSGSAVPEGKRWYVWIKDSAQNRLFKSYGNRKETAITRAVELADNLTNCYHQPIKERKRV